MLIPQYYKMKYFFHVCSFVDSSRPAQNVGELPRKPSPARPSTEGPSAATQPDKTEEGSGWDEEGWGEMDVSLHKYLILITEKTSCNIKDLYIFASCFVMIFNGKHNEVNDISVYDR